MNKSCCSLSGSSLILFRVMKRSALSFLPSRLVLFPPRPSSHCASLSLQTPSRCFHLVTTVVLVGQLPTPMAYRISTRAPGHGIDDTRMPRKGSHELPALDIPHKQLPT